MKQQPLTPDVLNRVHDLVQARLRRPIKNQHDDVVGSILLSVCRRLKDRQIALDDPDQMWPVLEAIVVRHCEKHNKRNQRHPAPLPLAVARPAADGQTLPGHDPADTAAPPTAAPDLLDFLQGHLDERELHVLQLWLEGKTQVEIAAKLERSRALTCVLMQRIMDKLKAAYDALERE